MFNAVCSSLFTSKYFSSPEEEYVKRSEPGILTSHTEGNWTSKAIEFAYTTVDIKKWPHIWKTRKKDKIEVRDVITGHQ